MLVTHISQAKSGRATHNMMGTTGSLCLIVEENLELVLGLIAQLCLECTGCISSITTFSRSYLFT